MPIMRILRGASASGKSTYRKEFIAANPDWRYTNLDEIRATFPGLREYEVLQTQSDGLVEAMKDGVNIIVDNTHLNDRAVDRLQALAARYSYDVEIKEFHVNWRQAIDNDAHRDNSVGRSVIIMQHMRIGTYDDTRRKILLVDLDGTLCNIDHRRHFVQSTPKNWPMFFAGIPYDSVNEPVRETCMAFIDRGYDIVFMSGRGEEYRGFTEAWLHANGFMNNYHMLIMRGFNDHRPDDIVKRELYEKYVEPYFDVLLVLDDRNSVVNMWRKTGLMCFQVQEGNF
jgi:predicted kinase